MSSNTEKNFTIRTMTIDDYEGLYALWMTIKGFGMRSIDDSRVGVERFLKRNPETSVVAVAEDGSIVGGILCGHDGRRGCLYHVCVREDYRRNGTLHECAEGGAGEQGQSHCFYGK